jgi:hypothetical protein
MSRIVLIAAVGVVFLVRDALLLGKLGRRALALYSLAATLVFAALGAIAELVSRDQVIELLREPRFWVPAVAIHCIYGLVTMLARRSRFLPPWVLLMAPAPMYLLAAGAVGWLVLQRLSGMDGWAAGALLGAAWSGAVAALSGRAARGSWNPQEWSAAANLAAIVLVPLEQRGGESGAPPAPVDWLASLLPLAAVVSLVVVSFAVHRYRSSRHAASS